jgi:ABC-type Zn uptake system ZnuABC Zn-binding protein ZnuA
MLVSTLLLLIGVAGAPPAAIHRLAPPLRVVASLPTYGAIAREVVGD